MTYRISALHRFAFAQDFCQVTMDTVAGGFPLHSHDFVEMVIILNGHAEHQIDERVYRVGSGDVYVLQGNTEHGFGRPTGDFRLCNVMYRTDLVSFPVERLKALPGYQALFVLEPARRRDGEFRSRLQLTPVHLKEALEKVQRLQHELATRTPGFDSAGQAHLLELIVFLSRRYSEATDATTVGLLRLGEAVAWMEENYLEPASVAALARRAAMSERHFLRVFRQTFGTSPLEHLIQLRVQHAARLLAAGRHNVSEAAMAGGFRDSNYFARQFRRIQGMAPRQYLHLVRARSS